MNDYSRLKIHSIIANADAGWLRPRLLRPEGLAVAEARMPGVGSATSITPAGRGENLRVFRELKDPRSEHAFTEVTGFAGRLGYISVMASLRDDPRFSLSPEETRAFLIGAHPLEQS